MTNVGFSVKSSRYDLLRRLCQVFRILRDAIVNRTYGRPKNLPGIYLAIFTNTIWSYLLCSLVIVYVYVPHAGYTQQ